MVNIDSLGLSDTKVWVAHADKAMLEAAGVIARAAKLPVAGVNLGQAGDTDSRTFLDNKIPVIDFHSVTTETFPILHTPRDKISAVRLPEYENTFALLVAYLAYLDLTWRAGGEFPHSSKHQ